MSHSLRSVWGHSVYFANCSMLKKIFKRLLLAQLSSNFNQTLSKVCYSGENTGRYVFSDLINLKKLRNFEDKSTQLAITYLVSSGKGSSRISRCMGLFFHFKTTFKLRPHLWLHRWSKKARTKLHLSAISLSVPAG